MDVTTIFNMALGRIGVSRWIAHPEENSAEAIACRRFYANARDFALSDYDWNCSRRRAALNPLAGGLPTTWPYKYQFPADCLVPRFFEVPGVRTPAAEQRIPFEPAYEEIGGHEARVIYTDVAPAEAVLVYTRRLVNPQLFDAQLASAIAYLLASEIAIPLAVKPDLARAARDGYVFAINRAAALMMNARQEDPEPAPASVRWRNA